jgi:hypothetical protein
MLRIIGRWVPIGAASFDVATPAYFWGWGTSQIGLPSKTVDPIMPYALLVNVLSSGRPDVSAFVHGMGGSGYLIRRIPGRHADLAVEDGVTVRQTFTSSPAPPLARGEMQSI